MKINSQPIEKSVLSNGELLDVHSIFHTIQGEGPFCGCAAVFIRLAGCNLQCPACDTEYTTGRTFRSTKEIAYAANLHRGANTNLVVISGGEPFRQNISPLCHMLINRGFTVQVETNGTLAPPPDFPAGVMIVCSPKAGKVNRHTEARADCYKYVMSHTSMAADGLPTLALGHSAVPHVARPSNSKRIPIYLQPMDAQDVEENKRNVDAVVASCLQNGHILQLQVHKLVNLE